VYPACNQTTCAISDVIHENSLLSSTVAWTAASGVEHLLLVTLKELFSIPSKLPEFELQIVADNDLCEKAFGPITINPGLGTFLSGSTVRAAADSQAPSCDSTSNATASGVWYTVIGDGGLITASTCTETDFNSHISVFTGDSCDQLACVDGNNTGCGIQSLFNFESIQFETYYVFVHGFGDASGNFALRTFTPLQDLSSPQYEALDWMTNEDSTDLQSTMSNDELVERFVLLVLYFATGGESWVSQHGFLNPLNTHCSWNSGELGVVCNDQGSVVELDLCKFSHSHQLASL
jgi:hypothetical protein